MRLKHGNGLHSQGIAQWMALALAVAAPAAWLAACSGDVDAPPQQAGAAGGTGGASSTAATSSGNASSSMAGGGALVATASATTGGGLIDASLDQWWVYDGPAYDGDMSCAPAKTGIYELVSCCAGQPCFGDCELHDGAWTCICFGIEGGCGPFGMTCCMIGLGCTASSCFGGP